MSKHPAAAPQPPHALADAVVRPRQCGRCRGMFEGDLTVAPGPFPDWWLCDDCQRKLLPGRPARVAPSARVRPE